MSTYVCVHSVSALVYNIQRWRTSGCSLYSLLCGYCSVAAQFKKIIPTIRGILFFSFSKMPLDSLGPYPLPAEATLLCGTLSRPRKEWIGRYWWRAGRPARRKRNGAPSPPSSGNRGKEPFFLPIKFFLSGPFLHPRDDGIQPTSKRPRMDGYRATYPVGPTRFKHESLSQRELTKRR